MRIMEVTDFYFPWIAGPAPFIRNLSSGLALLGHDVTIVCPSPTGKPYTEKSDGIELHRVRTLPVPFGYKLRAGLPVADMFNLSGSWKPDVIHIHHPFPVSAAGVIAARARGIPIVATNHTIPDCTLFGIRDSPFFSPAKAAFSLEIRAVLSSASVVTTPTKTAANMLRDIGFRRDIVPISNGVDTDRFRPDQSQDRDDLPVVLYTGRLDDDKDMDTFVQAIPVVLARTQCRFRIGGEGTDRARLERMVEDMGLNEAVTFTGYVSDTGLPSVYQNASLYAIPSRVELQSISTLEAMASGLPIVAVDAGALPELVQNGVNGYLTAPGDWQSFGDRVAGILQDQEMAAEMGRMSRGIAEGHSVGAMITQYERVLDLATTNTAMETAYGAARN